MPPGGGETSGKAMNNTVAAFMRKKREGKKNSMLTCYDYTTAKLLDAAGVDGVLEGDSLGCVILGYPDTLSVTMEDMIRHGGAVVRGCSGALVADRIRAVTDAGIPVQAHLGMTPQSINALSGFRVQHGRASRGYMLP